MRGSVTVRTPQAVICAVVALLFALLVFGCSKKELRPDSDSREGADRLSVERLVRDAQSALGADDLERADGLVSEALALAPASSVARTLRADLALLYAWRGWDVSEGYDQAFRDLDRAIALEPGLAEAYLYRGWLYIDVDRNDDALVDLNMAIESDPDEGLAYTCRGGALVNLGRDTEAIEDLDRALKFNPYDGYAFSNRGAALLNLGRNAEALGDLDER